MQRSRPRLSKSGRFLKSEKFLLDYIRFWNIIQITCVLLFSAIDVACVSCNVLQKYRKVLRIDVSVELFDSVIISCKLVVFSSYSF